MKAKWIILNVIIFLFARAFAQSEEQEKRIILNCNNEPLRFVLEEIKVQSGINFIYPDDLVSNINITCRVEDSSPENVLKKILSGHNLLFKKFSPNYFVLFKKEKKISDNTTAIVLDKDIPDADTLVLSKPVIISEFAPIYPTEAVKNNIEGKVAVKFLVNKNGDVSRTIIEFSSGSVILDSAAVQYVQSLKFTPAQTNGKPQNVWMRMSLDYLFQKN